MRILVLLIVVLFPAVMKADGTLFLSDVESLLNQQPVLWNAIKQGFELRNIGIAPRIGLMQNKTLHGYRIAPYTFDAKPKNSNGPFIFTITIQAKTRFLSKKDTEVSLAEA